MNRHAFTIIGVDKGLSYVGAFATEEATVGQGRKFTPEEIASGAWV